MSRWKRHSDEGLRRPLELPSGFIATMSSGVVCTLGSPLGVMRKPSPRRALTLPAVPRFRPAAELRFTAATDRLRRAPLRAGAAASQRGDAQDLPRIDLVRVFQHRLVGL